MLKKRNANNHLNSVLDKKMEKTLELEKMNEENNKNKEYNISIMNLCKSYNKKLDSVNSKIDIYKRKINILNNYFRLIYK